VLAVMIVPILQVFGGGLATTETARAYSTAALLARSKLAEVGVEEDLEEGEKTGVFEGYEWRRTISRSELTPAETDDRDEPDEAGDSRARRQRRESQSFGERESGRSSFSNRRRDFGERESGRSSFSQRQGGFGERRGGFGERESGRSSFSERQGGFGERRGGFGERQGGFGRSGQSAAPAGRSGLSDSRGTDVGDAGGQQSEDMIPYEVTVTVEWGTRAGGGTLSLSTLRLGPQTAAAQTGRR
jgi:hypothetical protein